MGATLTVDPDDDLERAVLESETISGADSPDGLDWSDDSIGSDDLIGAMTRTLAPGTVALASDSGETLEVTGDSIEVHNSGAPDDRSGAIIHDRYQLLRQLGKGGMGTVYIARHTTLPKTFAVKVLNPRYAGRWDIAERFLQEARAVSLVEHENVVGVIDFGREDDGSAFLVMEHLRGESLAAVCRREAPLSWPRVRHIMLQLCRALQAAHTAGIVHRDIKPENVLRVERFDDPDFIKVLDFGLAKLQYGGGVRLTATGMVLGTPDYMSPEQARGQPSDHRTDIYAAGVMMYELLTGRVPFSAKTFPELRNKHLFEQPAPPSSHTAQLGSTWGATAPDGMSEQIDAVVLRALAKQPEQRFASMTEFSQAIEAVGTDAAPVERPPPSAALLSERSHVSGAGRPASSTTRLPATELLAESEPESEPERESVPSERESGRRGRVAIMIGVAALAVVAGVATAVLVAAAREREAVSQAATSTQPSVPDQVSLRFETNVPVVVRDLDGGTPFGDQPVHELQLPRSDAALRLVLWADGYREMHVVITPDRDQILEAKLELRPEPPPRQPEQQPPAVQVEPEPEPSRASGRGKRSQTERASEPEPAKSEKQVNAEHSFAPEIRDPFGGN